MRIAQVPPLKRSEQCRPGRGSASPPPAAGRGSGPGAGASDPPPEGRAAGRGKTGSCRPAPHRPAAPRSAPQPPGLSKRFGMRRRSPSAARSPAEPAGDRARGQGGAGAAGTGKLVWGRHGVAGTETWPRGGCEAPAPAPAPLPARSSCAGFQGDPLRRPLSCVFSAEEYGRSNLNKKIKK